MSEPMSFQDWETATREFTPKGRSKKLIAVDAALLRYHSTKQDSDKRALQEAVKTWINEDTLPLSLIRRPGNVLLEQATVKSPEEIARSLSKDEAQRIVEDIFVRAKLDWRTGFVGKLANNKWGVTLNAPSGIHNAFKLAKIGLNRTLAMQARPTPNGPAVAEKLLTDIIDETSVEVRDEVMVELGHVIPSFMNQLVNSVTPFLSVVMDAATTGWNLKNAIQAERRTNETGTHMASGLACGTPKHAIQAMIHTIKRERNADAFSASVSITAFCSRLVAMGADAGIATGPAIGLASNILKLGNIARIITRDVIEKKRANAWMAGKKVDIQSAFEICPVLGAYYVCCVPTSVLVNKIFDSPWGEVHKVDEVEKAIKDHVHPLQEEARALIQKHRFVIEALQNYPGVRPRPSAPSAASRWDSDFFPPPHRDW